MCGTTQYVATPQSKLLLPVGPTSSQDSCLFIQQGGPLKTFPFASCGLSHESNSPYLHFSFDLIIFSLVFPLATTRVFFHWLLLRAEPFRYKIYVMSEAKTKDPRSVTGGVWFKINGFRTRRRSNEEQLLSRRQRMFCKVGSLSHCQKYITPNDFFLPQITAFIV